MQDCCGGGGTRRSECGRCGIGKGRWVWSWRGGITWRKWRTWRGGGGEEEGEVGRCCGVEGSRRWESERQCRLQHGKTGALHQVCQPRFVFCWQCVCGWQCTCAPHHGCRGRRIPYAVAGGAFLPQSRVAQVRLPQSRVKHRGAGPFTAREVVRTKKDNTCNNTTRT